MTLQNKINKLTRDKVRLEKINSKLEAEISHLEVLIKIKDRELYKYKMIKDLVDKSYDIN